MYLCSSVGDFIESCVDRVNALLSFFSTNLHVLLCKFDFSLLPVLTEDSKEKQLQVFTHALYWSWFSH